MMMMQRWFPLQDAMTDKLKELVAADEVLMAAVSNSGTHIAQMWVNLCEGTISITQFLGELSEWCYDNDPEYASQMSEAVWGTSSKEGV